MNKEQSWAQQLLRSERYARMIEKLFQEAIKEASYSVYPINVNPDKAFNIDDYPALKDRFDRFFAKIVRDMRMVIITGVQREWENANAENDGLVDEVLKTLDLSKEVVSKYKTRNLDSLATFQGRKTAGMNLSDRVWKLTKQFKQELELAIDVGLGESKSAAELSRVVRQYLNEPNKLFRRVRDKRGQLQLSKAARAYNPGKGVYRSSYMNAMRLTRTEINMAYRDADYQRWQDLDFIVGFEVKRSNNKVACDLCDAFVGRYPKTYKFIGNHPHCRCVCTPILASKGEIEKHFDDILSGKESEITSAYEVKQMPKGWQDWIKDNKQRVVKMANQPYFIKDNFKGGTITGGLKFTR